MAGYPRVTHPSATKLWNDHLVQAPHSLSITPFDLHVLGTPPAFILSQDQTLMFILPVQKPSGFLSVEWFLIPLGVSFFFSEILLLNFQGCIAVYLSRFLFCPSRTQLWYNITAFITGQDLFSIFYNFLKLLLPFVIKLHSPLWRWSFIIAPYLNACQYFFHRITGLLVKSLV